MGKLMSDNLHVVGIMKGNEEIASSFFTKVFKSLKQILQIHETFQKGWHELKLSLCHKKNFGLVWIENFTFVSMGRDHRGKRRKCWFPECSPSTAPFSRAFKHQIMKDRVWWRWKQEKATRTLHMGWSKKKNLKKMERMLKASFFSFFHNVF